MTAAYYTLVALFAAAWLLIGARLTWWLIAMREGFCEALAEFIEVYLT